MAAINETAPKKLGSADGGAESADESRDAGEPEAGTEGKAPSDSKGTLAPRKEKERAAKSGWSKAVARPGEELLVAARLSGFAPKTTVLFKVFPVTGDASAPLANLRGSSDDAGLAFAEWVYVHDPIKVKEPRLVFEAEADGVKALSTVLVIVDSISLVLIDENGKPVKNKKVRLVDALGDVHVATTPADGRASFERVACGDCVFKVQGYEIVGERPGAPRKFRSGTAHTVSMREMTFTVEVSSPKDGEVYLAGDRIPVSALVKRVGKPWEARPVITANNGARVTGGAPEGGGGGGSSAAKGAGPLVLLPSKEGEVEIQAKFEDAVTTVKVKTVRPVVEEVKLGGPDAFEVYDPARKALHKGHAIFEKDGTVRWQHAGAYRFGRKLSATVKLVSAEALSKPVSIELALATPALDDRGLPPAKGLDKLAQKPLTLRLPKDKRDGGVEFKGGEVGTEVELESDRPLPSCVRSYTWNLEVRLNQKGPSGWTQTDVNLPIWPKHGELRGIELHSVWGPAKLGAGKELEPGENALKQSEYDPFHLRLACRWGDGGYDLLPGGDGSISARVVENLGHLRWPEDYDGLRGKGAGEHARPLNHEHLGGDDIHPGGGEVCGSCKGTIENKACTKCGRTADGAIAAYRCATCKAGPWNHPTAVASSCPECNKPWKGAYMFLWTSGAYQCSYVGCNMRVGTSPLPSCPSCRTPRTLVEVQCAACKEWLDQRLFGQGRHVCVGGSPMSKATEPTEKNWGWGVVSSPSHPGGKHHQVTSLTSAALGTLGVKTSILFLRPRPGGAVNTVEDDPVTRGAECFDPRRDWGRPQLSFVGVPVDRSRDDDYSGKKLHEDDTFVLDPVSKKTGLQKDAATTGHERKKPDPQKLVNNLCRCGHEFTTVSRVVHAASFQFQGGWNAFLELARTPVKVTGELAVEVAVPSTLYGVEDIISGPSWGWALLEGPGGRYQKQIGQGIVNWQSQSGLLKTGRIEFGAVVPGDYMLSVEAGFYNVRYHPYWVENSFQGHATVTVHARTPGLPKPETINEGVFEVGTDTRSTLDVKTSGKLIVSLIDGYLNNYQYQPYYAYGQVNGPLTTVNVQVDGGQARQVHRGQSVDFGDVGDGDHKLTFSNPYGWWNWRFRVAVTTNTVDKTARPRPCPTCGAQPNWAYKCAQCGKEVPKGASGKHGCGAPLDGIFAQSIIYACPNCKKTVHDGDSECWGCGAKLEARKPEQRFGQPAQASAQGGEKVEDKKGPAKKDEGEASPRPAGRFDLFCSNSRWHAVLTLGSAGQPSFVNFGYFHPNYSREEVRDPKWDEKTRTLTFTRAFENRERQDYKLVFEPDGSFKGTYAGASECHGARRTVPDFAPTPRGAYDIFTVNRYWHGVLTIEGDDPGALSGSINYGVYHPGYGLEQLSNVRWDAQNHTLTFLRPGCTQRHWVTFTDGGRTFHGTFSFANAWYTAEGSKR